jgi:hypothetical protein
LMSMSRFQHVTVTPVSQLPESPDSNQLQLLEPMIAHLNVEVFITPRCQKDPHRVQLPPLH